MKAVLNVIDWYKYFKPGKMEKFRLFIENR